MNTKKIIVLVLFALFFASSAAVAANTADDNRYLVQTTKSFWKNTLGARHVFNDGFTTDLSDWQLRLVKIAGLKVYPVKKLSILPEQYQETALPEAKPDQTSRGKPSPSPSMRPLPSQQVPWGIKMLYDDQLLTQPSGGASVSVAVLDTGVFSGHPDLSRRIKQCKDFTQAKQPILDGQCDDKNGHGTHVAGIIAADGGADGLGIYGVAPQADLFAYRVCGNNGSCWSDDIAAAIYEASDKGANIINMSLGSDSVSSLISDAVSYAASKGVLVVAAAGNDGPYFGSIDYPGALVPVIAVGALDSGRNVPDWSSRGINSTTTAYSVQERDIEFAAPGVNVESTWKDGGYVILSGTSMASPHIAGLAAKLWQKTETNPAAATRDLLHAIKVDLDPAGDDDISGWGLPTLSGQGAPTP